MRKYDSIVDRIQVSLAEAGECDLDVLSHLAEDYASACSEVNQRLSECDQLLQRGLRSEAIRRAEQEPQLLDVVARLDFAERNEWNELLQDFGIPRAPSILLDVAAELNQAYDAERPLADLLRKHRLLALARAPLPSRIQVLRSIRGADPLNPIWADDLATLESFRLKQIPAELELARGSADKPSMKALLREISSHDWIAPIPATLTTWLPEASGSSGTGPSHVAELEDSVPHDALSKETTRDGQHTWSIGIPTLAITACAAVIVSLLAGFSPRLSLALLGVLCAFLTAAILFQEAAQTKRGLIAGVCYYAAGLVLIVEAMMVVAAALRT